MAQITKQIGGRPIGPVISRRSRVTHVGEISARLSRISHGHPKRNEREREPLRHRRRLLDPRVQVNKIFLFTFIAETGACDEMLECDFKEEKNKKALSVPSR